MFVVDTNILVYAVNPDAAEHDAAYAALETWRCGERPWFLTWSIVYEFIRVVTHRSVFDTPLTLPAAWAWIDAVLASTSASVLVETDRHRHVLAELAEHHSRVAGNPVHDLHIAAVMKEHGVSELQTADTDFHQFPFVRVVSPV